MRQRTVLLIASNPREVQRTRRAFEEAGLHPTLRVVSDGQEALADLRQEGVGAELHPAPPPDVIVLDLPPLRLSGLELVKCLKQDPQLKRLPIIVLAPSLGADEVRQVYAAGVNACLCKPVAYSRFAEAMGCLGRFWLEIVEFPSND